MYSVTQKQLISGLQRWNREYAFLAPVQQDLLSGYRYFAPGTWQPEHFTFPAIRDAFPLKQSFFLPRQKVAEYPASPHAIAPPPPLVLLFPKACDLQALKIMDKVFAEGDYPDPYYLQARENVILIASDCTQAGPYCFCTLMNSRPFPRENFDLNVTPVGRSYLIEIGSEKGEKLLHTFFPQIKPAQKSQLSRLQKQREEIQKRVEENNSQFQYYQSHQEAIERHLDSDIWEYLSRTCVECGICTQICPTCHCFLLYDQPAGKKYERIKVWDSCFFAGYARMAGGLTPRLRLADRFKNRFYHKFDSFVTNFGMEACTGCGRCVEGCMGNIDLREVLLELEKTVVLKGEKELGL